MDTKKFCFRCGQRILEGSAGVFGFFKAVKPMKYFEFKDKATNEEVYYCENCAHIKVEEERKAKK